MTQQTTTLQDRINAIQAENEAKIKAEMLRTEASEKTGIVLDNVIAYRDNSLGFGWREPLGKDAVKAIFKAYPISGENYKMTFASSEKNFPTDSPLVVKWINSENLGTNQFELRYTSNGTEIKIKVPLSHFGSHVYGQLQKGKHIGFGNYQQWRNYEIDYFYTQKYAGGYRVLYFLEGAESRKEYENFVITGEFQYESEID